MAQRLPDPSRLDAPLTTLAGIGARRAAVLRDRFDLHCVRDLLAIRPLGYDGAERVSTLAAARAQGNAVLEGTVVAVRSWLSRGRLWIVRVALAVEGETLNASFYNQRWLKERLQRGERIVVSGKLAGNDLDAARLVDPRDLERGTGLVPRYPVAPGIPPRSLRTWIRSALELLADVPLESAVPRGSRFHGEAPDRARAYVWLHAPRDPEQAERARRRLAVEELARLRVKVGARTAAPGRATHTLVVDDDLDRRILRRLPFRPTNDQRAAMTALRGDLARELGSTRLLIGDVGTGKTAVAFYGLLAAIAAGRGACLVAPTEALAHQHAETFHGWLRGSRTRVELVTGKTRRPGGRRGEPRLLVGTHALMHGARRDDTGFCVIDEQHRFGTRQKTRLAARHPRAHVLSMTATPIPRTLAHALWGSVAISALKEKPPGRRPVATRVWESAAGLPSVLVEVEADLRAARGLALWICPRVAARSTPAPGEPLPVLERARHLATTWRDLPVLALHGRLPADERERRLRAFRSGACRVLVASSVIEVGMDFPEATRLVIEGAERFGLVQLHQMRGRIGRGARGGLAHVLVAGDKRESLALLETEQDGEALARVDLHQRGPGALLGEKQHGLLRGRFFDWRRDLDLLEAISEEGDQW